MIRLHHTKSQFSFHTYPIDLSIHQLSLPSLYHVFTPCPTDTEPLHIAPLSHTIIECYERCIPGSICLEWPPRPRATTSALARVVAWTWTDTRRISNPVCITNRVLFSLSDTISIRKTPNLMKNAIKLVQTWRIRWPLELTREGGCARAYALQLRTSDTLISQQIHTCLSIQTLSVHISVCPHILPFISKS